MNYISIKEVGGNSLSRANKLLAGTDISDTMRQIIQNGVILYALAKAKGGSSNE